jgi:hypothetical protein
MLVRIKNYSVVTAGDEVLRGCAQREVCHFVSNWVGECLHFKIKDDIENKERRKRPQSKYGTVTRHNHDHINVAGVQLISGFRSESGVN